MAKGKYTPELADQIIDLIRQGNFESIAYGACGISPDTYYRWKKEKPEFSESLKKAKNERISSLIKEVRNADAWQARCWLLERMDRKRFHLPTGTEKELLDRIEKLEKLVKQDEDWGGITRPSKMYDGTKEEGGALNEHTRKD